MKISASIYSDSSRPLDEVIQDLQEHQVDLFHVDCNDKLSVFEDIRKIKEQSSIPVDLHIISNDPNKYIPYLETANVEYVTFQYEQLPADFEFPTHLKSKLGLAVITPTPISVFEKYCHLDFILIMATIPGQSGGKFDSVNFKKIREFRKRFPATSIHVDGGVNAEISFILRNMGVTTSVSGSYLFNEKTVGNALMNLTKRDVESEIEIKDFMIPLEESPIVTLENLSLENILLSIEKGRAGFCIITDNGKLTGIISNADVRKVLLKNIENLQNADVKEMINRTPLTIQEGETVVHLLQKIKHAPFPVMYLPVVDLNENAVGMITFVNLIKGEL